MIQDKCIVVYYPLDLHNIEKYRTNNQRKESNSILHIVWPHRWEFDKDPNSFMNIICKLKDHNLNFKVSLHYKLFLNV